MYRAIRPSLFILILMVSLGPFSDTVYAPALPNLKKILATDYHHVQLTISSYLAGYSISQIIYGPLSDRFGRKPIMLIGSILFIISSIICILINDIDTLIYARLLQGLGASAGGIIATVAVKDVFKLEEQGPTFALMNIAFGLAPAIGALFGILLSIKLIFWVLLIAAIFLLIQVVLFFPETLQQKNYEALKITALMKNYLSIFKEHQFLFSVLALGMNISVIYACAVELPNILFHTLGFDKFNFLYLFIVVVMAVIICSIICAKLSHLIAYKHLINFGMLCVLISGILFVYAFKNLTNTELSVTLIGILSLTFIGVSFSVPLLTPIALENFSSTAGYACSVMGFMQIGIASITTAIMSQTNLSSESSLSFILIILPIIGLAIFFPYSCYFLNKK